jgi:hypothetical protein
MGPSCLPFKAVGLEHGEAPLLAALDPVIRQATHEVVAERYHTVAEMRAAVQSATGKAVPAATQLSAPRSKTHDRWIWMGVVAAIISVLGMTLYHLYNGFENVNKPAVVKSEPHQNTAGSPASSSTPLPATWIAEDGRTMMLVPPAENLPAFYTDKSPVTFHHYVEFLNSAIDRVRVDNGVVKHKEEIWAYLGDGSAP